MITLYWCPQSRAARTFWALEEVGQPYELQLVDFRGSDRSDPPEFLAASPLGKVPALTDGDAKVADSAAIALYLADRYAAGDLAPRPQDAARGEYLFWLFYTPSAMEPSMVEKFVELPPNPKSYPWGSFDKMIAALETRLQNRQWLAADRFTMADLMVSGTIQTLTDFKIHDPSPLLKAYVERCFSRPALARGQAKEAAATAALTVCRLTG